MKASFVIALRPYTMQNEKEEWIIPGTGEEYFLGKWE
jgi:hypothetical protein